MPERRLPNINLLIGNNGTGKTTTFQAFALAALGPLLATGSSGFRTAWFIRHGESSANGVAHLLLSQLDTATGPVGKDPFVPLQGNRATFTVKRKGTNEILGPRESWPGWAENLFEDYHPGLFLAAYGASRRTERPEAYNERQRGTRYQRVASLFEQHVGLIPLSMAYTQCMTYERWDEVVDIVNELLAPPIRLTKNLESDSEPLFDYDGVSLPSEALSDGYRLFVGWLIDFLTHLSRVLPKHYHLTDAVGVVIVDEIDLFLSPSWQRTVLETISRTFKNIQWLCSTHSPLVAGALDQENIYILKHAAPFTSTMRRPTDAFEGKSVDEVLVELFNVKQPRSPEMQRQLSDLAEEALKGNMEASLEYLRRLNQGTVRQPK